MNMFAGPLEYAARMNKREGQAERNWLVHCSRSDSRNAVHGDLAMQQLTERLDAMAEMALSLLKVVGSISRNEVDTTTIAELLNRYLQKYTPVCGELQYVDRLRAN